MADIQKLNVNGNTYDISTTWEKVTGKPATFPPSSHQHEKITHKLWGYSNAISDTTSPADICAKFNIGVSSVNAIFPGIVQNATGGRYQSLFWTGYGAAGLVELSKSYGSDGRLKYRVSEGWSDGGAHWSAAGYRELANIEDLTWTNIESKPTTIAGYGITDAYTATTIDNKLSGYLPLSGGIMNYDAQIKFQGSNSSGSSRWSMAAYGPTFQIQFGDYGSSSTPYVGLELNNYGEMFNFGNLVIHSGNYNSYAPTLTGTGASGTWGINISGNASTATSATTATKLSSDAGSSTNPIYFSGGKPVACTYSLNKTVPSNAVFTDTNTWRPVTNTYTGSDQSTCVSQYGTNALYNALVNGYASSAGTSTYASRLGDSNSYYTKSSLDTALAGKANSSHGTHLSGSAALYSNSSSGSNCNNVTYNLIGYYTSNGPSTSLGASTNDGSLYSQAYSSSWVSQIAQDYRNGNLFTRGKNNGTWTAWKAVSYNGHTHNYAGSSSAGGAATSVVVSDSNANSTYRMVWHSGNSLYSTDNIYCNPSTDYLYSKGFYQTSDERLKIFYEPIKPDLEKLRKLRKNYFKFNDKDKLEIGVSAQEVQSIYPEIVSTDDNGYLSVAYDKLSVIALAAIDELDNKYKKEINDLKDQLDAIKNILNEKGIL